MFVKLLQLDHEYDEHSHRTSYFISTHMQFAFRAVALGYCVSTIISNFVYTDSYTFFTFFTNLSYMILVIYFGFMVYLSVHYNDYTKALSDNKLRAVNVLLEVVATNALFLDIVYWTLLYRLSGEMKLMQYFYCINVHMINLFIITTEVATSKLRFFPRHLAFTLMFLAIYSVFSIVYFLLSDTWIYPILNWHDPKAPFIYAGVFILNIACFFVMYGVFKLREKIAAKKRITTSNYVIIENLEAGQSFPKIDGFGSRGSFGKTSDFIVPKSFEIKTETSTAKTEDRGNFAQIDIPVSYGSVKPTTYAVTYPAVAMAGSGVM